MNHKAYPKCNSKMIVGSLAGYHNEITWKQGGLDILSAGLSPGEQQVISYISPDCGYPESYPE